MNTNISLLSLLKLVLASFNRLVLRFELYESVAGET